MKIVKLMGGLGNQMFQYAFGQVLDPETRYDITRYSKKYKKSSLQRFYELENWQIKPVIASKKEIAYLKNKSFFTKLIRFFSLGLLKKTGKNIRKEKIENVYDPSLLKGDGYFEGYFQCAKYYNEIRPKLLKDFQPSQKLSVENEKMLQKISETESVSLHVRRTDYLNFPELFPVCNLEYYSKAIQYIAQMVKKPHFFLFSDDIEWVKQNLKINFPYTVVDINHDRKSFLDIWLMKHCKHNIIANSSFSWWGAWLNENPNKIVVAPKVWFGNGIPTDIIPPDWKRI